MRDNKELEQVARFDGVGCFVEVMLSGLAYDKVLLNFKQYDKNAPKGSRSKGDISIFLDVDKAAVLSKDIFSGRIAKLGVASKKAARDAGKQYADYIYESVGGTGEKRAENGELVPAKARQFTIAPGASQPWVLCAKQGPGKKVGNGLIAMDGKPDIAIRVPMTNETLKLFALSLETVYRLWSELRFLSVAAPIVQVGQDRRKETLDRMKSSSAAEGVFCGIEAPDEEVEKLSA